MSKQIMSKSVREYLQRIGQKGGEAGRGRAKARGSAAHYRELSRLSWVARRKAAREQRVKGGAI
jgi:hypothetical protein